MNDTSHGTDAAFVLLRESNPVDLDDVRRRLDEGALAAARREALEAQPPDWAPAVVRRRRLAAATGLVAVCAVAWGLLATLPGGSEPARAQRLLQAAASLAARQHATAPARGEYTYVKERRGLIGGPAETVEWWISSDGLGRVHRTGGEVVGVIASANGRIYRIRAWGKNGPRTARDITFGRGGFAEAYDRVNPGLLHGHVDDLPTERGALTRVLGQKVRDAADFNPDPRALSLQMLQVIEEVLANPLASPALRSAAYEIAGRLQGVKVTQQATDPAGRAATAISLCSAIIPARYEIFFDPSTAATLGTREADTDSCSATRSLPTGLTGYSVYLQTATVGSIHRRPASPQTE
jgi:hypothetical protein